ncbi:unnamed protein product [Penicillium egyptiacum]|uniref:Uncharacterized protein n=1 Tax=Penicillium egyptiacum TaxID=1303716 RepID=A0A9W4K9P2_9EURO|nr:unnamed protein product [Penicillium egyptiacum]
MTFVADCVDEFEALISVVILDATLHSLDSIFQQCDDRPTKRRKTTKRGARSLTQENGVSRAGVPLGYIPLARLTMRIKPSNTNTHKYQRPYDPNLPTTRVPIFIDVRSVHFLGEDPNNTPQPDSADSGPNRMELELSSLDEKELLIYPCEDPRLFDFLGQLQAASKLAHVDQFSKRVPTACYQAHLCALPDGAGFTLETVVLWKDSIEVPDSNRLGEADLEVFTRYVLQEKCVRPSALTDPREYRDKMLGTPKEWSPRDFYKNVHVPKGEKPGQMAKLCLWENFPKATFQRLSNPLEMPMDGPTTSVIFSWF